MRVIQTDSSGQHLIQDSHAASPRLSKAIADGKSEEEGINNNILSSLLESSKHEGFLSTSFFFLANFLIAVDADLRFPSFVPSRGRKHTDCRMRYFVVLPSRPISRER